MIKKNKSGCLVYKVVSFLAVFLLSGTAFAGAGDGKYTWPVDKSIGVLCSDWYYSSSKNYHGGLDLNASIGSKVYSIASGTVITVNDVGCTGTHRSGGPRCKRSICNGKANGSYGNYIVIQHDNNVYSWYAHLSTGTLKVKKGDRVRQGQLIGYSGNAGNTTAPHLHLEIRIGGNKYMVNNAPPLNYLTRKNVSSEGVKPSNLRISTDRNEYVVGEPINFTFSADNATTRMAIPIDINGKRAEWLDVSGRNSYSYKTHTVGQYYYTLYAQNPSGEINLDFIPIKVVANSPAIPSGYRIVYPVSGVYSVKTHLASDMALTVQNASTVNHARVVIDKFTGRKNQQWKIQRIGNSEWYNIIDLNSGKSLDNEGGRHQNSNNVWLWPDTGRCEQWRFIDAGNGEYYIQANTASCYMLDVQNGWTNANNPVWLYQFNKSNAQKWKLEKASTYNNTRIKGDVNGDGRVNKQDVDLLLAYVQGKTNNIIVENGDVNNDGKINVMDVVALNKKIK